MARRVTATLMTPNVREFRLKNYDKILKALELQKIADVRRSYLRKILESRKVLCHACEQEIGDGQVLLSVWSKKTRSYHDFCALQKHIATQDEVNNAQAMKRGINWTW